VSTRNRDKRIRNRETRLTAFEVAKKRARRRRWEVATGGLVLAIIVAIVFLVNHNSDNSTKTATTTTTTGGSTTTTAPVASAAGKPCVKVSDPLPQGAPAVPVKVGPPPTTLVKEDLKIGTGAVVKPTATVKVNYIGVSCSTGAIFDSSYVGGPTPVEFPLSGVIKGWTEGIPGMKVGGERLLGIPPALAYGAAGQGAKIAPDETLWFVVDLVSITKP
jgi:peptidylprolyl isomerase